jgi:hypothetical protein
VYETVYKRPVIHRSPTESQNPLHSEAQMHEHRWRAEHAGPSFKKPGPVSDTFGNSRGSLLPTIPCNELLSLLMGILLATSAARERVFQPHQAQVRRSI